MQTLQQFRSTHEVLAPTDPRLRQYLEETHEDGFIDNFDDDVAKAKAFHFYHNIVDVAGEDTIVRRVIIELKDSGKFEWLNSLSYCAEDTLAQAEHELFNL
jgi:hypothetical protein